MRCCKRMEVMLVAGMVCVIPAYPSPYPALRREKATFGLPLDDGNHLGPYAIDFCPWCGARIEPEATN